MALSISMSRLHLEDDNDSGVLGVLLVIEEEVQLSGLDTAGDGGEDVVQQPLASPPVDALKRGFSIALTKEEIAEDFPSISNPIDLLQWQHLWITEQLWRRGQHLRVDPQRTPIQPPLQPHQ